MESYEKLKEKVDFNEIMLMKKSGFSEKEIADKFNISIHELRYFVGKTIRLTKY